MPGVVIIELLSLGQINKSAIISSITPPDFFRQRFIEIGIGPDRSLEQACYALRYKHKPRNGLYFVCENPHHSGSDLRHHLLQSRLGLLYINVSGQLNVLARNQFTVELSSCSMYQLIRKRPSLNVAPLPGERAESDVRACREFARKSRAVSMVLKQIFTSIILELSIIIIILE
jgi:hypothetical protein